MKRNPCIAQLKSNYLFPEINSRKKAFLEQNPGITLTSLGIGDTTEPLPQQIASAMSHFSLELATAKGYVGYGPEQGMEMLREQIALKIYQNRISPEEIFISDGAKCDLGRLQLLFGNGISAAVQDPAYPVYVEGSLLTGVREVVFMPCTPENGFFPDLSQTPRTDLIYFCSPNNPTGASATKSQLEELVSFARRNRSIIIFDAAYANFIQDDSLPKSIFEIDGAKEVAIEISSFSKLAGFTGVRLGWTVIPKGLCYEDGSSVKSDWSRLMTTIFNGASAIAQKGGLAVLKENGLQEIANLTKFYMENASILKQALEAIRLEVYGGTNAPYLWVRFKGEKSWDIFQWLLEKCHLLSTPGSGFGPAGEGFVRFSAFGHRENILQAADRLQHKLQAAYETCLIS